MVFQSQLTFDDKVRVGEDLIRRLVAAGMVVSQAYWAKLEGGDDLCLQMVSPSVDKDGLFNSYMLVGTTLRAMSQSAVSSFEVVLVGVEYKPYEPPPDNVHLPDSRWETRES